MELPNFMKPDKNKIFNLAIIIVALLIAQKIYKAQNKTMQALSEKEAIEIKKNEVLTNIEQLEGKAKLYKDLFNKKDISSTINVLGNLAEEAGVKIISLRPLAEETHPLYVEYGFSLAVSADNYHLLGKFISKVESHPDVYIIKEATIRQETERTKGSAAEKEKILMDLKISTPLLKD